MDSILALAETLTVKFEDYATAINLHVIENHGIASVDEYDRASWKYYQNITGEYHFSDEQMLVASLDLPQSIVFSRTNLALHQTTRSAYQYGSRYYRELVQQYPDQEQLILGILYPCDMQTALDAVDGTILSYPKYLVEETEASLIPNLQQWIYNYLGRWVNRPFAITEDLYTAAYTGQLYMHLVGAITNARKAACHGEEVHSFHLQQYLASHGHLDRYLKFLTREQALFLYRNINYLQRYAGKINTFDWLVEKVITLRGFPLYSYSMNHRLEDMHAESEFQEASILPEAMFQRKGINALAQINARENFSMDQVLLKTIELAPGNEEYQNYERSSMRQSFEYSPSAVVNTKLLESSATDYSNVVAYTVEAIALQHWLRHVAHNRYQATVLVNLPHNPLALRLSAQHTVALFLYCVMRALATKQEHGDANWLAQLRVPKYTTLKVMRSPLPTFTQLRAQASRKHVSDTTVQEILDTGVEFTQLISIDAFYDYCVSVFKASNLQYRYMCMQEHHYARSEVDLLGLSLYAQEINTLGALADPLEPTLGLPYNTLTSSLGLDFTKFTRQEFYESAIRLYQDATGVGTRSVTSQGDIQKAMVELFMELSSYSIRVVQDTTVQELIPLHFPGVQIGDIDTSVKTTAAIVGAPVTVIAVNGNTVKQVLLPVEVPINGSAITAGGNKYLDVGLRTVHRNQAGYRFRLNTELEIGSDAPSVDAFNQLDAIDRSYLVDGYGFNADNYLSILQAQLGKFILQPTEKNVEVLSWNNESVVIPAWELTNRVKTITLNEPSRAYKNVSGFDWSNPAGTLTDIAWDSATKTLPDLHFSAGYVRLGNIRYVSQTKNLTDKTYSPVSRDIDFTITRTIKHLNIFTYPKAHKTLDGFDLGSGESGVVI